MAMLPGRSSAIFLTWVCIPTTQDSRIERHACFTASLHLPATQHLQWLSVVEINEMEFRIFSVVPRLFPCISP